ncbi:uncharacterized protein BHQ10_003526 [Talaromyces amestolkiae]|uniref:FAD-binding domain-containing protein n=1 Tax=Talaromyces amestolkiae TaxID=1196081 RepID=A0A364KVE4_TALAM|nr:uncharacterized protein BHQ10_003526 [Talaromyces amestolkiae]RAO67514.1 hypothetical protein BHQ10_003526 [Talaromyces amestolkiae]
MTESDEYETTDVVICGCGPTGAMLSAYLGQMSIKNVVLEKEADITTDPRGIALDEDGIRFLQGLGIYDGIYTEIGTCMNIFKFVDGTKPDLSRKAFLEMDYGTTEGGTGHVGFICHKQPVLERYLRDKMAANGLCALRSGCSVTHLSESEEWTYCEYTDAEGKTHHIRSKFFVGADGKTGYTRKRYLEPKGIQMERAHNSFYEETWVALNWHISIPNKESHPDFPLWSLGYTPEQVYDLFFPVHFRFLCNPKRPAVCGRFGPLADRLWRFEFVVLKDEDGTEMAKPHMMRKIIFPYITHPGSRYGLPSDVQYPEDCINVLRSRPFMFSARSCNRWSEGRVVLCGDAAHVFPPFGGQGIASGFRDASSLAWRLAVLCKASTQGLTLPHEKFFTAWYLERKQQLEKSLASTITNGEFVTESNPIKIFIRNWSLWFMQLIPSWRDKLRLGQRHEGLFRYQYSNGMPFIPSLNGGLCVPQVYCKSLNSDNNVYFTDDVIFKGKKGLFQLLVYLKAPNDMILAGKDAFDIETISQGHIYESDITCITEADPQTLTSYAKNEPCYPTYSIATGEEFAKSELCKGRPEPKYFDPYRMRKELKGHKYTILRPDRFVFASCSTREDLVKAVRALVMYLNGSEMGMH